MIEGIPNDIRAIVVYFLCIPRGNYDVNMVLRLYNRAFSRDLNISFKPRAQRQFKSDCGNHSEF